MTLLLSSALLRAALAADPAPPHPAEVAGDPVLADLAARRDGAAVRSLRRAVARAEDDAERAALRCVLGHAQRQAGDRSGALATLAQVPVEAPCGPRAAFDRAEVLEELGRVAEAAALVAEVGASRMDERRDREVAETLGRLIGKLREVEAPDGSLPPEASRRERALYSQALALTLPPDQRLLVAFEAGARELEARTRPGDGRSSLGGEVAKVLQEALIDGIADATFEARARRMAARLVGGTTGLDLLEGVEGGAADRARVVATVDAAAGRDALEAAVLADPQDADLRRELADGLLSAGQPGRARPHLVALADGDSAHAPEALLQLAELDRAVSRDPVAGLDAASAHLVGWLDRFGAHPRRGEAEQRLARSRLDAARAALQAGDPADAALRYAAFLDAHPRWSDRAGATWERAEALRQAGDLPGATAALEGLLARGEALDRALATLFEIKVAQGDAAAAMAWLEALGRGDGALAQQARAERERREAPALRLEAGPRPESADPEGRDRVPVRLHVRNLDTVSLRLHRIDAEALLRSGGTAAGLPDLDVAVIAPDREWTAALGEGEPGVDREVEVPVRLPGPGLYALTAATETRQAQVVLRAGRGRVLARGVGEELVVGVLDGDRPDPGARVLVASGGRVQETRADRGGVVRLEVPEGEARVLALGRGGPSLLDLSWSARPPADHLTVGADLDRPAYLPGDRVGFRIAGRRGGQPVPGDWWVWIRAGGVDGVPVRLPADARGAVTGSLDLPELPAAALGGTAQLLARAPGEEEGRSVAQLTIAEAADPLARRLAVARADAGGLDITVEDVDGAPIPEAVVEVRTGDRPVETLRVDATGRLRLAPLAAPQPRWVRLPGQGWRAAPPPQGALPVGVSVDQEQPAAGAPLALTVRGGSGMATVRVSRRLERIPDVLPPPSPLEIGPPAGLTGPTEWVGLAPATDDHPDGGPGEVPWTGDAPGEGLRDPQRIQLPGDDAAAVALDGLPAGHWVVRVIPDDPRAGTAEVELEVGAAGPTVSALPERLTAGSTVPVSTPGPALVTLEGEGLVDAALVTGGAARFSIPWGQPELRVVAVDPDGRGAGRIRPVDRDLEVELEVQATPTTWSVRAAVTGPDGGAAPAQVALRLVDARLIEQLGGHLRPLLGGGLPLGDGSTAWGGPLHMLADAEGISGALLAERAREEEARRAARASRGNLQGGRLAEVMASEDVSIGLGGLGTSGRGSGGGGYGSGSGRFGAKSAGVAGGRRGAELGPAHRERLLWQVAETGRDGVLTVELPAPPPGDWVIEAHALTERAAGAAEAEQRTVTPAWLATPTLGAAAPGDRVRPRVRVVHEGDAPLAATVRVGDVTQEVTVPARGVADVALPELTAGQRATVTLSADGQPLDTAEVGVPVQAPVEADAAGGLARVGVGVGGGAPLLALLEAASSDADLGAVARKGRAQLAAARVLPGEAAQQARGEALDALHALRALGRHHKASSARAQADVVAFLHALRDDPDAHVTRGELEAALAHLATLPRDSRDRVAVVWAQAVAGAPVDAPGLGRLLREAGDLDAESRAWLARALVALGRPEQARPLVEGDGPHAILARRALAGGGPGVQPAGIVPAASDLDFAHVLDALAGTERRRAGGAPVVVRVDGAPVATLSPATGGLVSVPLSATSAISADGAWVDRGRPAPGAEPVRTELRPMGAGGRPVPVAAPSGEPTCGQPDRPCALRVGDALRLATRGPRADVAWGPGMHDGVATAPGTFAITGLTVSTPGGEAPAAPLWVAVQPASAPLDPATLHPGAALLLAEEAAAVGEDPAGWLAPWPAFDDWSEQLRPRAMHLRWQAAQGAPAAQRVAAFEALRDADPTASLTLPQVANVAEAYAEIGQPARALEVWRAGLGAAFLAEAAPLRRMEQAVGRLPSLQALQRLPLRYPDVPVVAEAEFHLPERLAALIDEGLPTELLEEGITPTDVRLLAAAWDRRFLAFHPDSDFAPQAGFHLAQGLLRLGAHAGAAEQAARTAAAFPETPVLDGLRYVEGLALAELGRSGASRERFEALALQTDWPTPSGDVGPAGLRPDARYALARLDEAAGRLDDAREGYAEVAGSFPEAAQARAALDAVTLVAPGQVLLGPGEAATVEIEAANVTQVHLRAYRLDLRTVFLRDGGLQRVRDVRVSGVSPSWSGVRTIRVGPYPGPAALDLPLLGAGAWLVELDGAGASARTLVVRSDLRLSAQDGAAGRRVVVQRGGRPAAGVDLRALVGGGAAQAATTDLRGVAVLPTGAPVLAFSGEHVAFSDPLAGAPRRAPGRAPHPAPNPLENLDRRIQKQRMDNQIDFEETYQLEQSGAIDANAL